MGLNISGASRMILAESFWTPGERIQLEGRVPRMPQQRIVYIYDAYADYSHMDRLLRERMETKKTFADEMDSFLTRFDREQTIMPPMPTREEFKIINEIPEKKPGIWEEREEDEDITG